MPLSQRLPGKPAGSLVVLYGEDRLGAVLREVLGSDTLCAEMRQRGLERAAQYSWERTARETLALYERVIAARD